VQNDADGEGLGGEGEGGVVDVLGEEVDHGRELGGREGGRERGREGGREGGVWGINKIINK